MLVGKTEKGKVFHGILADGKSNKNNHAACDKRQKGLVVDATLTAVAITCSSCLKRVDVRDAIELLKKDKTTIGMPNAETMPTGKKPGAVGPAAGSIPEPEKEKELVKEKGSIDKGDWRLRPDKKGSYSIVHLPSKKAFFNAIPKSVANDALEELAKIKEGWKGLSKPMPKDFINNCRVALRTAYSSNNKVAPKYLLEAGDGKGKKGSKPVGPVKGDRITTNVNGGKVILEFNGENYVQVEPKPVEPKKEKKKRTIKRREKKTTKETKKPKRTIKRRKPERVAEEVATAADKKSSKKRTIKRRDKKDTLLGRGKGTPGYTVLEMLKEGSTMFQLVEALVKKHGMSEKKAWTKIRAVIRKTTRKQNIPVVIVMSCNDPGLDYYSSDLVNPVVAGTVTETE